MKYALLLLFFCSELSLACSCLHERSMDEVVKNSSVIFYGETIGIEPTGKLVESYEYQKYQVTVRPQKVFKGNAKNKYKYKFKAQQLYGGEYNPEPGIEEIIVGGCGLDLLLGDEYIIFIEKNKPKNWSWCSEHILPKGTDKYDYFFKNIEPKL